MACPTSHMYFLGKRFSFGRMMVYQGNTSDKWDIPRYTTRGRCVTILYHAIDEIILRFCNFFLGSCSLLVEGYPTAKTFDTFIMLLLLWLPTQPK